MTGSASGDFDGFADVLARSPVRPVRMRDVAEAAGVSVSAVSYVLNNTRPVRADKRARVLKAMAELEYVPNGMAQALRRTRSGILGVVLPDIALRSYGLLARHIEATAHDAQYMTVICSTAGNDEARAAAYIRRLHALRADGLILRTTRDQRELLPAVVQAGLPTVLMMSDPPPLGDHLDRVVIDNALGVRLAVRELAQAGHHQIGLVSSQDLSKPTMVRLQGFLGGMEEAGLQADMGLVRIGASTREAGARMTAELLDAPRRPTALILAHWSQALGALHTLRTRGVRAPEDLSIIVFGRPEYFDLYPADLTMVTLPLEDLATQAAQLLINRLSGSLPSDAEGMRRIVLEPSLYRGATVGPPQDVVR